MTGKKGGKSKPRPKTTFNVVQQSYEDKDYDGEAPKPVLVPANHLKKKKRTPMFRMGEDMPEDFSQKRNMLMQDDEAEDEELANNGKVFFADEVEEDFDNDFIEQMMHGEASSEDDEETEKAQKLLNDEEAKSYPKHEDLTGLMDKQFDKMLKDFDRDEEIEEDDPRVQGALDVREYAPALEEFVEEHAGTSYASELPVKHRGLLNQFRGMSREHGMFNSDAHGTFVTTLLPDKNKRISENFHHDVRELKEITIEMLKKRKEDEEHALAVTKAAGGTGKGIAGTATEVETGPDGQKLPPEGRTFVTLKDKRLEVDCETILTTYTDVYNHPNTIKAASKKKVLLPGQHMAGKMSMEQQQKLEKERRLKAKQDKKDGMGAGGDETLPGDDGDALDDLDEDGDDVYAMNNGETALERAAMLGIDLSHPPKDESADEKKLRRQLVKQLQKERREEKKKLKGAYKNLGVETAVITKQQKINKRQTSLSAMSYSK